MTDSEIHVFGFERQAIAIWAAASHKNNNWPVVYTINNSNQIYVGETTNAELRMRQHLVSSTKAGLKNVNVIIDDSFNKSVCLDLESHLIKYFHADEKYEVLNGNGGITDADYFDRELYRRAFDEIFQRLVESGQLTRSIPELVNSDLFKYSPFKALTTDQAIAVEEILELFFQNLESKTKANPVVIQGDPGTGKTIVAVYLMKLLRDIARSNSDEALEVDSVFADFFQSGFRELLENLQIGLVIPQLSLRKTLKKVFSKTPGLNDSMVLDPFEVGSSKIIYDLLIVDEAHRLQQRNNQPAAQRNIQFREINKQLFGLDDTRFTQLDWVYARSKTQIFLLDRAQSVKPADLNASTVSELVAKAKSGSAFFTLTSQMRVEGGEDYIEYISSIMSDSYAGAKKQFGSYDVKLFSSFAAMNNAIRNKNTEVGLSRLVSGFAWPWLTRKGAAFDIEIDGVHLAWNRRNYDWINSETSIDEVGSIHTVQGYDLNFTGVIIGNDLGFDTLTNKIVFRRENYFDVKGKENNKVLGKKYTDEDLQVFVTSIYRVLLTRGVKGTYIYVVDKNLRKHLSQFFDVV